MDKNTGIIIGVIALVAIVGGVYASTNKKDEVMEGKKMDYSAMMKKENETMNKDEEMNGDEMMKKGEAEMANKEEVGMSDIEMDKGDMMMKGSYEAYSMEKLARAETGDVVLFFHASWCPSCRGLNSDIEKNIASIPEGVSILKVDYDTEMELKKKYGVTTQHTLVQVDKDGNLIKKWSGSPKLSSLVSEIQ